MGFSGLQQPRHALNPLAVSPVKTDVFGKAAVGIFIVGMAQNTAGGVQKNRVYRWIKHALPAVLCQPAGAWQAAFGLMARIAFG